MKPDWISCGPTPPEEPCTGNNGDQGRIRLENRQWKRQLEEVFKHHTAIYFSVKSFPHDFGSYSEVCVNYSTPEGLVQALDVDSKLPYEWDKTAQEALADYDSRKACKA